MTADIRQLITDLQTLGYNVLSYKRGAVYVAGIGIRDLHWCRSTVRLHIERKGRAA